MKQVLRVAVSIGSVIVAAGVMWSELAGQNRVPPCDADNGGLKLPSGFCAQVVAENLGVARHMAVAPNGDLFVSLRDQTQPPNTEIPGAVVGLRDANGDGRFGGGGADSRGMRHRRLAQVTCRVRASQVNSASVGHARLS